MSAFHEIAESMVAALKLESFLERCEIIMDRQGDLNNELERALAKVGGEGCLIVRWAGSSITEDDADDPVCVSNYEIGAFFKPILRKGTTPADDLVQHVAAVLHNTVPSDNGHCDYDRLIFRGVRPEPDAVYLAYVLSFTCRTILKPITNNQ